MIYFDNAATTYPKPRCVIDGVNYALNNYAFNAGRGSYNFAQKTFEMIETTREKISGIIGANKNDVIFTSSATEALNNVIYGLNFSEGDVVFVSPFEHNSVIRTLQNVGADIHIIPFDNKTWKLLSNEFENELLFCNPKACIISHISNATGFELPYCEIFDITKKQNCINILDCAQSFGIYEIKKEKCDYVVFAGHKSLYGIYGVAGYIKLTSIEQACVKVGGTGSNSLSLKMPDDAPYRYEAGSYNSIAIYSIFLSIDFLKNNNFALKKHELSEYFIKKVYNNKKIKLYLPDGYISNGIVSFTVEGYSSDEVGSILSNEYDICVRTGYHCAPFLKDFLCIKKYNGTVRISFGFFNTFDEVDYLINALAKL